MVVNQRARRYTSLTWKVENAMERLNIIHTVVEMTRAKTYLEIGVASGAVFFRVKAKSKIAVDPRFEFSTMKQIRYLIKNPWNVTNQYYEMTSDEYFQNEGANVERRGLDVAFVDGLHTFEQSLRDVSNCLRYLNQGGVIILHDCNPPSEAAAFPAASFDHARKANVSGWTGDWCGDTWKTIVYLRSVNANLRIFVLDCDTGVGIITRGSPDATLDFTKERIDRLSYDRLRKNRAEWLNLKKPHLIRDLLERAGCGASESVRDGKKVGDVFHV